MTAKEKAEELVNKYLEVSEWMYQAKQCTLIAIDEIIKQESTYDPSISDILFWKLVKQEIEKL